MSSSRLQEFRRREFIDPAPFFVRLREIEPAIASSGLPERVKSLRGNDLKEWREAREAALFYYGISQRIGQIVYLSRGESQDYDFVASWIVGDEQHFASVQLKEVPPESL